MKVSGLLAHYLYQKKRLNLPGLGSFFIADSVVVPDIHDKNFREFLQYIQFSSDSINKPDTELIDYIRSRTGKIKPLAEADLEAFIGEGKELLNISKPFFIDGVGVLQKNRNGKLEFSTGEPLLENLPGEPRPESQPTKVNVFNSEIAASRPQSNNLKGILFFVSILLGLALIVGVGYVWYSKNTSEEKTDVTAANQASNVVAPSVDTNKVKNNTDSLSIKKDTVTHVVASVPIPVGNYKFVFETTDNKERALRRYKIVHGYNRQIQLETKDSSIFKIYVFIPVAAKDTTRKKDSLNAWYWGEKKIKIQIEQ